MGGWDVAGLQFLLSRCELTVGGIDGVFGALTDRRAELSASCGADSRRRCRQDDDRGPAPSPWMPRAARRGSPRCEGRGAGRGRLERPAGGERAPLRRRPARWSFGRAGRPCSVDPGSLARPWIRRAVRRALHSDAGQAIRLRVDVLESPRERLRDDRRPSRVCATRGRQGPRSPRPQTEDQPGTAGLPSRPRLPREQCLPAASAASTVR